MDYNDLVAIRLIFLVFSITIQINWPYIIEKFDL